MNEKISVIVPVFNVEKYLESSLRSIMNQTYRNLEIICVNDGSTDDSPGILRRLAAEDSRITVIDQENRGLGPTKNRGIEASSSEWISFIDPDDTIRRDTFELCAACFSMDPDMIHFGIEVVREDGLAPSKSDVRYYRQRLSGLKNMTPRRLVKTDGSSNNKIFRRSVLDRYGIRFGSIRYEDFQFTVQYRSVIDTVYYIPQNLYRYLRRSGSIMNDSFAGSLKAVDHLTAFTNAYHFVERNGRLPKFLPALGKLFESSFYFALRFVPEDAVGKVVETADAIYFENPPLMDVVTREDKNDTVTYRLNDQMHILSKYLQYVFSLRCEWFGYKRYKVMRVFNIVVSSRRV